MNTQTILALLVLPVLLLSCSPAPAPEIQFPVYADPPIAGPATVRETATSLAASMDLRELAGQILIVSPGNSPAPSQRFLALQDSVPVGGVILMRYNIGEDAAAVQDMNAQLQQAALNTGAGIPLFISVDHEGGTVFRLHGVVDRLPDAAELGKSGLNGRQVQELYYHSGQQLRRLGFSMNYAPILEPLLPENRDFLRYRAYSTEPERVYELGGAMTTAMLQAGILPVAKHFPGSGDGDPHYTLPLFAAISDADAAPLSAAARHPALYGFRRAIHELQLPAIMSAHVRAPALDPVLPATISPRIQQQLLRDELGFSGLVITDDLYMRGMTLSYRPAEAGVLALKAGADMLLVMGPGYPAVHDAIRTAVADGTLTRSRLEESVIRILEHKLRLDLAGQAQGLRSGSSAQLN
ncbi:glycoside hydrolase family 3 N-terminal domain-containing protein [Spirochaeta africana]|uniref:glycoside hydrolase family 3 N-terminal domain-containing protein n=1 Tax=Spirochaeta africana TaxID=46355 RepID=UPI000300D151|nr:glycoside hydrolase family 3 N-terminal domain-containing protein [Spirochaeta africana]